MSEINQKNLLADNIINNFYITIQVVDQKNMDVKQKNVFGKNEFTINVQPINRNINDEQKKEIIDYLNNLKIKSVSLQFEYSQETQEFSKKIASTLREAGFNVYGENDTRIASGIKRGEFSILKHPADPSFAIIRIGSIF